MRKARSSSRPLLPPPLAAPAAMELPESQCKKVKLSNRVPSWVSGERCACGQMGVWSGRGEQRGGEAAAELGGDVAVGGGRAGGVPAPGGGCSARGAASRDR